ncbi:AbiH family protein [Acinetobacter sp. ASP199]|uniref:AbiH family protein n=1 Tax=unclassified Acinetobacter TaxID=196816 RepID=UPI001F61A7C3|nr:AbiH family protein [Acinetobacter sp. ASP199]UNT58972.1 hypothetical protein IHE35_12965 [Acinetobacter sp. ASP199]
MNILIVGNGFDLSHYLPTKYDHFMDVMEAIENKELGKPLNDLVTSHFENVGDLIVKFLQLKKAINPQTYEMNFDELFSQCRDRDFITKTKQIYVTDNIKLSFEKIIEIKFLLKNNPWYQYFKNHVKEVKTWIDFEQKIEEVILSTSQCCSDILNIHDNSKIYYYFENSKDEELKISKKNLNILNFFEFVKPERYETTRMRPIAGYGSDTSMSKSYSDRLNINPEYCYGGKIINGFNPLLFLDKLHSQLEEFIEIFNLYLKLIISNLQTTSKFLIQSEDWVSPDKIYSFNYTNTFQRLYDNIPIDYLHGSYGEEQNIVLGVSELEDESLKKLKVYGFTKYHQKLFKDTDYLFLDEYKRKVEENLYLLKAHEATEYDTAHSKQKNRERWVKKGLLDLNIVIWGHSLDYSDKEYIIDLFSLNDEIDRNIRVVVYYFDKSAKFSLLNNLLAILDKDKVEQWMKNGWLKFEKNPEIHFGAQEEVDQEKEAS